MQLKYLKFGVIYKQRPLTTKNKDQSQEESNQNLLYFMKVLLLVVLKIGTYIT